MLCKQGVDKKMQTIKVRDITIGEGLPKIIVPIVGSSEQELMSEIEKVMAMEPDIIEWRADTFEFVEDLHSVMKVLGKISKLVKNVPLLFTFRTVHEGGHKEIPLEYYEQLMEKVIQSRVADMVDVELFLDDMMVKRLVSTAKENQVYVVLSNHDFQKTPKKEEIISRLIDMQNLGADIPKIAVMPKNKEDVITLLEVTNIMKEKYADRPFITISMGGDGLISRLSCHVFGSVATFASGVSESAPGQIPVSELKKVLAIIHKYS